MDEPRSAVPFELRLGTHAELEGFLELLEDAAVWLSAKGIQQWTPPGSQRAQHAAVANQLDAGALILAYSGRVLAGGCCVTRRPTEVWTDRAEHAAYLSRLVVARDYAGTRLSQAIVAKCAEWAKSGGLRSLRLDCWAGNDRLRSIYGALGFEERGIVPEQDWFVRLFEMPIV